MKRVLPNLLLRVGFVAVLTLCWILLPDGEVVSSSANPALDPDERFVLESGQAVGRLSFEILEDKTGVHRATIKRCVNSRGGEYPSGLT